MKRLRAAQALILLSMTFLIVLPAGASAMRGVQLASRSGEVLDLYTDYYALVIGVGRYTNGWPDLPGALKDSQEVAAALEEYGFKVKHVANPTSREIKKSITEMAFVTGKEQQRALLLYFAGHGETLNLADGTKLGYIVPADCPLKDKDPLGFDDLAVSMKEIEALALKVQSKHVLMVFDSCFSGALFSLVRAAPVEISEKSARPVRQFITAGSEGEQVPDRSVFKQVFLDGIKSDADLNNDGYVTASELGMYLQTKVVNYSSGGQHPQYGKINNPRLDKGDFVFVPKATRQKEAMETAKVGADKTQISEELKRLQEERKKNEELLEKLKQLLEAKTKADEAQKTGLEEKLKSAEKERQSGQSEMDEKIRRMEAQGKAAEERLGREAAERKALEEELRKLRAEGKAVHEKETTKVEEVKVASIPREVTEPKPRKMVEEEPHLKVAIFPMHPEPDRDRRELFMKAIQVAIDTSDLFREEYSVYEVEDRPDVKRIDGDLQKKEIWKRKNFFSTPEPNMDVISEEAKKLGVDAVFALYLDPDKNYLNMTAFMINTSKKKVYSTEGRMTRGDRQTFPNMLRKVFSDYGQDL